MTTIVRPDRHTLSTEPVPPGPCFYILARGRFGALSLRTSEDLAAELRRDRLAKQHNPRVYVRRLVHLELHDDPRSAKERWRQVMRWSAGHKLLLIRSTNPDWIDYAQHWLI
ncbi:MAG TPA: hypothetical protein PKE27_04325 [Povalibacter sp.]|uniref:hypothetical protein n=1 Tax=Povalibacter sp. TaxID=1962978 RepID=UPI002BED8C03|nr:hypothetical protein [Povalibacter sp.]HMN43770.1 hypothetical protein [Povalibacter sp.]